MLFTGEKVSAGPSGDDRATALRETREVSRGRRQIQDRVEEADMYELLETEDEGLLGWQERALCAQTDPEAFFPEKGGSTREAKKVCLSCDVRGECLEYALSNDERFGIWGGLSERERRKLKKRA
jgi:WhiB family redox-sensing transcriptional regulator